MVSVLYIDFRSIFFKYTVVRVVGQFLRKLLRNRGCWFAIIQDLMSTRRSAKFLRNLFINDVGRVLIILVLDDDSINTVKQLAFVSQALRLQGWTVQVVFRNQSMVIGKLYFQAFGVRRFIYLEGYVLNAQEIALCQQKAEEFLLKPISLQAIKAWTFQGSWIGPQIIATLSRVRYEGSLQLNQPDIKLRIKEILVQSIQNVLRANKLFEEHPTDLAISNEVNYTAFGPLTDAAIGSGCDVIQVVQPWRDDALTCRRLTSKTRRQHPSSVSKNTLDRLVQKVWTDNEQKVLDQMFQDRYGGRWFLQERNQRNTRRYSVDELAIRFGLDRQKPTAVIFSHVLWDANLFYGDDLFEDYGEWFVETVRAACSNHALNWLIKVHPANVWKRNYERITQEYAELVLIDRAIGQLPDHVKLIAADDDICTLSLFESIDYGVTVRGTSGMELVCFGKHCVTAGTGRYSGLGFTLDSYDREQYYARLANLHLQPPMSIEETQRAKWHAYAAFELRPWKMLSAKAEYSYPKMGQGPLDHNLELTVSSLGDLEANGDLLKWAKWAIGKDIDYLDTQESRGEWLEIRDRKT